MNTKLTNQNFKINYTLTNEMLKLIWSISQNISLLSLSNNLSNYPKLKQANRIKSIHSSLSIENLQLTYDQVISVINERKVLGSPSDIIAVQNANRAYDMIDEVSYDDPKDLLRVHGIMMSKLMLNPGNIRKGPVYIVSRGKNKYDVIYKAPDYKEVSGLLNQLFYWLKNDNSPIVIKSCVFHYYLTCIHPFSDGNGRISRLWQTVILAKENPLFKWIPVESAIYKNRNEYYDILKQTNDTYDCTKFIEFILKQLNKSIIDVIKEMKLGNSTLPNHILKMLSIMGKNHLTSSEIMFKLKLRSKSGFIKNYLKPAIDAGVIGLTIPDKPTNKNQKYFKK